ncbi:MAG: pantetheine-phosphate adenylyltransferase [Candidatus Aenigmarchaeota archaeon]|nr:pantetheine-phosphate adenylyltransferase [Candidatus Aenigmarchaeota archaeon]
MKFEKVCLGGTFNPPIHIGHDALINKAFESGKFVVIGLTHDKYFYYLGKDKDWLKNEVKNYSERRSNLRAYLNTRGWDKRYMIVPLYHDYDDALVEDPKYCDAIIVSLETRPDAEKINEKRKKKGFPPLEIIQIKTVLAKDGLPVSSSRIRKGDIDRRGNILMEDRTLLNV